MTAQLRVRHAFLVDKKFHEGLTPQEEIELSQINKAIDKAEAKYYNPIKTVLNKLLRKAHKGA